MTEAEIKLEARLMAIERYLCHKHNVTVKLIGLMTGQTTEQLNAFEKESLEGLRLMPVMGVDPALSDVLSDEVFHNLRRLNEYAQFLRGKASD